MLLASLATAGAVAGYAVSRDSITVDLDHPKERIWDICVDELRRRGRIKREDRAGGRLDGMIQKADVVVTMGNLTPSAVRVVIRARKNMLPHLDVAQRLALDIARRAGEEGKASGSPAF